MPFKNVPPLYTIWQGMRRRCLTPTFKQWKDYGGRGIKICPEWSDFAQFVMDMGPRPTPEYTLEREDNDGDYTPQNCVWATRQQQAANRRSNVFITIDEISYNAYTLAKKYHVKADTIIARAKEGLGFQACITPGHLTWATGRPADSCKNGHPYTEENTRIFPNGRRACRICLRTNAQRQYWKDKKGA